MDPSFLLSYHCVALRIGLIVDRESLSVESYCAAEQKNVIDQGALYTKVLAVALLEALESLDKLPTEAVNKQTAGDFTRHRQ